MRCVGLLCIVFIPLPVVAQPHPPRTAATSTTWTEVTTTHAQQVDAAGIVGSSLVIVRDGHVGARAHVGRQDRTTDRRVDDDTIYHWASVTKTFTGIAIMQLRDRGQLTLDDAVVSHVPEFRQAHNPFGPPEQVTVRMLMSHTSGLRAATWPWGGQEPWHPFEPTRWDQLVAMLPYTALQFAPGSRYSYSNPGVILLGRIIEQLSGEDYETYVTKHILMPLGMHRTFFDRAPSHLRPHRSHSYTRDARGLHDAPFDFDTGITVSNGGLNAPMTDMARYLAFLQGLGPADWRTAHDHVLARASLHEMWQPAVRAADGEGGSGNDVHAGLSFFVERHGGTELVGHSGQQAGFVSHIYLHRPSNTAWAVAFNTDVTADASARPAPTTRAVDDAVRDAMVRLLTGAR